MATASQQPCTGVSSSSTKKKTTDPDGARSVAARNRNPTPCAPCQHSRQGCPGGFPCGKCIEKRKPERCVAGSPNVRRGSLSDVIFIPQTGQRLERRHRSLVQAESEALTHSPPDGFSAIVSSASCTSNIDRFGNGIMERMDSEIPISPGAPEDRNILGLQFCASPTEEPHSGFDILHHQTGSLHAHADEQIASSTFDVDFEAQLTETDPQSLNQLEFQYQQHAGQQEAPSASFARFQASDTAGEASMTYQHQVFPNVGPQCSGDIPVMFTYTDSNQGEMQSNVHYHNISNRLYSLEQAIDQPEADAQAPCTCGSQASDNVQQQEAHTFMQNWPGSYEELLPALTQPSCPSGTYGQPDVSPQLTADGTDVQASVNVPLTNLRSQLLGVNAEHSEYQPLVTTDHSSITTQVGYSGGAHVSLAESGYGLNLLDLTTPQYPVPLDFGNFRWIDEEISDDKLQEFLEYLELHKRDCYKYTIPPSEIPNTGFVD